MKSTQLTLSDPGLVAEFVRQQEFKAFWDADAKRVEDAVRQIGKVEG